MRFEQEVLTKDSAELTQQLQQDDQWTLRCGLAHHFVTLGFITW